MTTPIREVRAGQKVQPKADEFNTIAKTVNRINQTQLSTFAGDARARRVSPVVCLVKNATEEDLPRWSFVSVAEAIFSPVGTDPPPNDFLERLNLIATVPATNAHLARVAVLRDPLAADQIGEAVLLGVTPCRLNITDEAHTHARMADGTTLPVSSNDGPARIIWKQSGTGTKWALIEITAAVRRRNLFAVKVTRTGGSAGSATTAATWTYTVASLEGATIATGVPLARLRAVGLIDFAPSGSFGMAFYDETDTLRLWDVQEVPQTATC